MRIGLIGDHRPTYEPHMATESSINHAAQRLQIDAEIHWLPTDAIDHEVIDLALFNALWCAPGSPYKSISGALKAVRFARLNKVAFLGTCGGFQHTLLEYARNVIGLFNVEHQEISPEATDPFISRLACSLVGRVGTVTLSKDSLIYSAYNAASVDEMFRCGFGLNPRYYNMLENSSLKVTGVGPEGEPRVVELVDHPFYVATAFMPQMSSTVDNPHPLIEMYLRKAIESALS